jgi:tRNA A58 N-methylase Trm61
MKKVAVIDACKAMSKREGERVFDAGSGTGSLSATIARMTKEQQNQIEI